MPKTIDYALTFLQKDHLSAILEICKTQFGADFLSPSLLNCYLQDKNKFCHVVEHNNQVIGFSLMEIASRKEVAQKMKGEQAWFSAYFEAYDQVGYRSLTAVAQNFEGNGVASFLVQKGLEFLSHKVELVVCDAWKSEATHIGSILERNGCIAVKEIPNFWTEESLREHYHCTICGPPPCQCTAVIYARYFPRQKQYWWERADLNYKNKTLELAHTNISDFIQNKATPIYIYDLDRIVYKYQQLVAALARFKVPFKIFYAMKANRHPAILSHLKARTNAGIDVCSPNELERALQYGFKETQITYTGTSLSNKDLEVLAQHHQICINFDSLSALRRFIPLTNVREIGIRINPNIGMAYNQSLEYSGNDIVKFGIYKDQWKALKHLIDKSPLSITTVHCHSGSGFLTEQLQRLPLIFEQIDQFLTLFPSIKTLNLGGGLGVPQNEGDQVLDLDEWAQLICEYAKKRALKIAFEPGDYLVKDAGILVTQVNTVEQKMGKLFVGVDAGMNMNYEYAYYNMNLEAVPVQEPLHQKSIKATICGNINEPIDLFSEDKPLPIVKEGDYLALLNSGGYGASTSSNHCMRGDFKEYTICK
ncbi:diaminopimelate decarboxylase [Aureispira anguillae]|uniref:Diaminopimelate decarboxylase n=1 Tax=Aureispira anguillae TaxID=2864201 RepID=A0A915YBF9_9BACT|nr:diaminopimelate decarboxylase [Aureispira anguillae]BDS10005.1 diaminopimelate decarboxylase [Aureispira anguillae]